MASSPKGLELLVLSSRVDAYIFKHTFRSNNGFQTMTKYMYAVFRNLTEHNIEKVSL